MSMMNGWKEKELSRVLADSSPSSPVSKLGNGNDSPIALSETNQTARPLEEIVETSDPRCTHTQLIKTANKDRCLHNNLITRYSKSNLVSDALRVFHQIQNPNVVSWTALISGYANTNISFHHFLSMLRHPTLPNQRTLTSIFKTCASLSSFSFGLQVHSLSLKLCLSYVPFTGSALVSFYSKCKLPYEAVKVFDRIPTKDEVCYGAIIVGLAQNSQLTQALSVFSDMLYDNVKSSMYSVSGALCATAELAALEQCRIIHAHAVVRGLQSSLVVGTSLVDGYGKSGIVSDARRVFDEMLVGMNIIGWNAMMAAYAQQGDVNSVIELFDCMKQRGILADKLSFLAILTACSNVGSNLEAEKWLNCMSSDYRVEPELEHYTCVILALARNGQLEDATQLAKTMPFKPDAAVWRALLSSCAIHGETKMATEMSQKLLEKNSQDDSAYVILANVHAAAKSWGAVADLWKIMKDIGVKKRSGRSWIEVRGEVHEFLAFDKRHERTAEIYSKLEELMNAIMKLGYKEVSDAMLHQGEWDGKEKALWYHSEKLAVAFGVVSGAPPGKPLRVVKNLRICRDCHEAFKYMGRVIEREIVVRDVNRSGEIHKYPNTTKDQVAMSVNDIVTSGAKPLFFLDYYATSHLDVDLAEKVVKGIVDGCQQCDCVLLGGETAEMPDFYAEGEYDLSGFAVGTVSKDSVINGKNIVAGDVLIGLPSSGVHSNGVLDRSGLTVKDQLPGAGIKLGEALMAPTISYVKLAGRIEDVEMRRTFNLGIGMVIFVSPEASDRILGEYHGSNLTFRIGEVISGEGVTYQ
ncbi:Pentatricopeptide repeat-containing protein [Thalictrum thalictroides]|uniref:phosphoribosylformylglycinamidine cyclo-ligase n=1 Tax=Thalictrum thalictroides TaxID=46969 RepID=A0A7J6VKJ5_THATH|nr:Pentatricopeptide repeat-containing protein [Thalictrum thalictroides]